MSRTTNLIGWSGRRSGAHQPCWWPQPKKKFDNERESSMLCDNFVLCVVVISSSQAKPKMRCEIKKLNIYTFSWIDWIACLLVALSKFTVIWPKRKPQKRNEIISNWWRLKPNICLLLLLSLLLFSSVDSLWLSFCFVCVHFIFS